MRQRVLARAVIGACIALLCHETADADHLTGRYTMVSQDPRTAQMAGSVLQLQQNGRNLAGQISGTNFRAQLQGETDGGNNARGFMTPQGGQRQYFEATWEPAGIRLNLIATDRQGRPDYGAAITLLYAREGGAPGVGGMAPPGQPGIGGGYPQPGAAGGGYAPGPSPGQWPSGAAGGYPPAGQPGYPPQGQGYPPQGGAPPGFPSQGGMPPGYPPQSGMPPGYPQQGPPPGQWPQR